MSFAFLLHLAGDTFEIGSTRSRSRHSFDFSQKSQSRAYPGRSAGFAWPFHKSGNPETTSKVSLDRQSSSSSQADQGASKFRVVGRGGSGSKLRQVSLSNPIVVLEADTTTPPLRQPLDQGTVFYRPTGRGGLGSLSTSPPTIRTTTKPTTFMNLLRGRKRSDLQLNERYQTHKSSSPRKRPQSVYYGSRQIQDLEGIAGIPFRFF